MWSVMFMVALFACHVGVVWLVAKRPVQLTVTVVWKRHPDDDDGDDEGDDLEMAGRDYTKPRDEIRVN